MIPTVFAYQRKQYVLNQKNDLLKFIHCLWECKLHKPARITVAFNQALRNLILSLDQDVF